MEELKKKGAKLLSVDVTSKEQVKAGIEFIIKNEGGKLFMGLLIMRDTADME